MTQKIKKKKKKKEREENLKVSSRLFFVKSRRVSETYFSSPKGKISYKGTTTRVDEIALCGNYTHTHTHKKKKSFEKEFRSKERVPTLQNSSERETPVLLLLLLLLRIIIMASRILGRVALRGCKSRLLSGTIVPREQQQTRGYKVAVLGAAGGIGQPCGLLMKMNPLVSELRLYDIAGTPGVGADVSHINTKAQVKGYSQTDDGEDGLKNALKDCDLVIIPAGVPRKPGMTRDDLFKINAGIVKGLVEACADNCPKAMLNIISNPVNSTVPIAAETLKQKGVYDKKKLFGVTTLDVVRAKTFYAEKKGLETAKVDVPVIGGHAGVTILPLFSQATPKAALTDDEIDALTKRTQDGGTEVVAAKAGKGSATLSMAYAGALFGDACLRAKNGEAGVVECTYVESDVVPGVEFFATKVSLGREGVEKIHGTGTLTAYEQKGLDGMMEELKGSINKGLDFAKGA